MKKEVQKRGRNEKQMARIEKEMKQGQVGEEGKKGKQMGKNRKEMKQGQVKTGEGEKMESRQPEI